MPSLALGTDAIASVCAAPPGAVADCWPLIEAALEARGLRDPLVKAAALATVAVETGRAFRPIDEEGDPAYFTRLYENRADLGNTRKGDGARYHGRGFVQLTGRANYRDYGLRIGKPLEKRPALAKEPAVAAAVLALFFEDRGIEASATARDWEAVRRKVNGGLTAFEEFRSCVRALEHALGLPDPALDRPQRARTLMLTSPHMTGRDVAKAQVALTVPADREYGPVTAGAVVVWKRLSGFPEAKIDTTLSADDLKQLLGKQKLPAGYAKRAAARAEALRAAGKVPQAAVEVMETWAGFQERPPGSNVVPPLVRLARKLGVPEPAAAMGYPWCAFTVFLAALEVGGTSADLGLRRGAFNPLRCPDVLQTAQAAQHGLRVVSAAQARRGDIAVIDFASDPSPADHLGRLREPPANGRIHTVEGNTGDPNIFVKLCERPLNLVRAFVRDS